MVLLYTGLSIYNKKQEKVVKCGLVSIDIKLPLYEGLAYIEVAAAKL